MAARKRPNEESRRQPPAPTPEARENQVIAAAFDLAEKQIREGSASSQVISHFLKLGSSREKLEQERLAMEIELGEAKRQSMASATRVEELMSEAINAFRSYAGQDPVDGGIDD